MALSQGLIGEGYLNLLVKTRPEGILFIPVNNNSTFEAMCLTTVLYLRPSLAALPEWRMLVNANKSLSLVEILKGKVML